MNGHKNYDSIYMKFWERQNYVDRKWLLEIGYGEKIDHKVA